MNPRITLGLLAVLLTLGGYIYFGGAPADPNASAKPSIPGKPGSPPGAAGKEKPADPDLGVFTFDERAAQRLTVRNAAGQQVAVDKNPDSTWALQSSGEPADRLRISGIMLRLSNLRATRRIAPPPNLADFGLSQPSATATVTVADAGDLTLVLGGKAPAESGTYAQKGGDSAVYVISNAIAQDLERLLDEPPREPTPTTAPSPPPASTTTP